MSQLLIIQFQGFMGRLYRSTKRKAAHWILGQLVEQYSVVVTKDEGKDVYRKGYNYKTIKELAEQTKRFKIDILRDAAHFLYMNKHVDTLINTTDFDLVKLKGTINGEYAYRDSYYLMENRKDFNESIDSYAKWIVPVISLLISLVALYISLRTRS